MYVDKVIPVIVDVLALCVSKVTETEDVVLAKFSVTVLKALLNSLIKLLKLYNYNVSLLFSLSYNIVLDCFVDCSLCDFAFICVTTSIKSGLNILSQKLVQISLPKLI